MTTAAPFLAHRGRSAIALWTRGTEALRIAALPVLVIVMVTLGVGPWLGETASGHGASVFTEQPHVKVWLLIGPPLLVLLRVQFLPGERRPPTVSWRLIRRSIGVGLFAGAMTSLLAIGIWAAGRGHVSGSVAGLVAAVPVAAACTYAPTWLLLRPDADSTEAVARGIVTILQLRRKSLPVLGLSVGVVVAQWLVWSAPPAADWAMVGARAVVGVGVVGSAAVATRSLSQVEGGQAAPAVAGRRVPLVLSTVVLLVAVLATAGLLRPSVATDNSYGGGFGSGRVHGIDVRLHTSDAVPTTVSVLSVNAARRMTNVSARVGTARLSSGAPRPGSLATSVSVRPYGVFNLRLRWSGRVCNLGRVPVALRLTTLGHSRVQWYDVPVSLQYGC